jgi:lipid-A-disaccharide synthase
VHAVSPDVQFRVACYRDSQLQMCREILEAAIRRDPAIAEVPIDFHVGRTPEIIAAARCCLIVSGSVSLELLARRTPAVVVYRVTWWLTILRRLFVSCRFVTLPNLMASRELMPEFVFFGPHDQPVRQMAAILKRWLRDASEHHAVVEEYDELAQAVARPGGTTRTADSVLRQLGAGQHRKAA